MEQQPGGIDKEDVQVIDGLVRRLLSELADATWGRNTRFHKQWLLTAQGTTWQVRHATRAERFDVIADLAARIFRVDGAGEPLFTPTLRETELRRALAVIAKRGPGAIRG